MNRSALFAFLILFVISSGEQLDNVVNYQPQQIHIAYGGEILLYSYYKRRRKKQKALDSSSKATLFHCFYQFFVI